MNYLEHLPSSVIICDKDGVILEMNAKAAAGLDKEGGRNLIGTNILDCHPEPSRSKLAAQMAERRQNIYTSEKNGVKKLIYQSPWYKNDEYFGIIEISLEIPFEMPHHLR
ncbi:MAG: PAS domain-containing protein [Calditrichaeota bacterium]|nr:PAS domain-containing protein [Calditrichota bacterium]